MSEQQKPLSERDLADLLANAIFGENLDEMPTKREEYGPSWCQDDMLKAAREIQQAGFEVIKRQIPGMPSERSPA